VVDFEDSNGSNEDSELTFVFERPDVTDGPRTIVSTLHRSNYARHFHWLNTKYPVTAVGFDARPSDHPDRLAEDAALRQQLHAARLARGWRNANRR
jgi:hypothetical protein